MNEHDAITTVIDQCTSLDGFLVRLHSYNEFNITKFSILSDAIRRYQEILDNRDNINRRVAGCLLALSQELLIKLGSDSDKVVKKQVEKAHITIAELIDGLLPT